jgi:hypothetical protein
LNFLNFILFKTHFIPNAQKHLVFGVKFKKFKVQKVQEVQDFDGGMRMVTAVDSTQICPVCGRVNRAEQAKWRACCLLNFDFGGAELGLSAVVLSEEECPERFGNTEVRLILRRWMTDANDVIILTAGCRTLQELDGEIAALQRDLRKARKQAKQLLGR